MLSPAAKAVVVIGPPSFSTTDAFDLGSPFHAVVDIYAGGNSGTGILIDESHILTAKHVTRGKADWQIFVDFNDTNNNRIDLNGGPGGATFLNVTTKYEAPNPVSNVSDIDGTDLAILTLSTPMTTIPPMRLLGDMSYAVGKEGVMVGFGGYGVGDGSGISYQEKRRAGSNIIDSYGSAATPTGFFSNSTNIFSTDFDNGTVGNNTLSHLGSSSIALAQESTTAFADSGGPLLVEMNGEYLVAGVLSGGIDPNSEYGDISWWTGVGPYQSTIESFGGVFVTVPEPSVMLLLSGFALLVFGRRCDRRPQ